MSGDQTVALTGATGFLGSHILDQLLLAGFKVNALTRGKKINNDQVTWIAGDLENSAALHELCRGADYVIHVAGLVKALNRDAFFKTNVTGTSNVLDAAQSADIKGFIQVSSLTAREPSLSHYGASKRAAEEKVETFNGSFNWTIVRPGGIYGPRDMEILKILKCSKYGFLPAAGMQENHFDMIHVEDLASALVAQLSQPFKKDITEVGDASLNGYTMGNVADYVSEITQSRTPFVLHVPYFLLYAVGLLNGILAKIIRKPAILTQEKAREISHQNWVSSPEKRLNLPNWSPKFDLKSGLKDTFRWYKEKNLL